mmetsp:Transcript_3562/g.6818  ORF Transcript_3562/g.6818 Transcript_3562/m.6818 type:complete len:259 (+) Transcript_3562:39-815(+)
MRPEFASSNVVTPSCCSSSAASCCSACTSAKDESEPLSVTFGLSVEKSVGSTRSDASVRSVRSVLEPSPAATVSESDGLFFRNSASKRLAWAITAASAACVARKPPPPAAVSTAGAETAASTFSACTAERLHAGLRRSLPMRRASRLEKALPPFPLPLAPLLVGTPSDALSPAEEPRPGSVWRRLVRRADVCAIEALEDAALAAAAAAAAAPAAAAAAAAVALLLSPPTGSTSPSSLSSPAQRADTAWKTPSRRNLTS